MNRYVVILCTVFFAGFALGNLTGWYGWNYSDLNTNDRKAALVDKDQAHSSTASSKGTDIPISSTISPFTSSPISSSESANSPSQEAKLSPEEILLKHPPPHIADPHFFGPDPRDLEVIRLRKEALNDLIRTLKEAGLPDADIRAVFEKYENEINNLQAAEQPPNTPPPAPEETPPPPAPEETPPPPAPEETPPPPPAPEETADHQNTPGQDEHMVRNPETELHQPPSPPPDK